MHLSRRCKPNDTGEAYTGHHVARRGVRTPQSLRPPRKPLDADGDGVNAPEANTEAAFFFGELPEGLPGSTLERGRRGEKRQELGRPCRFQLAGTRWHGIRILSHALGKPSTHGRPDPKPEGKRKLVGQRNQKGARPMTTRESAPLIVLRDGRAVHTGKGRTATRSLQRKH